MRTDRPFSVVAYFALISCNCVSADFVALTGDTPVIVAVGDTAVIHCRTSVPDDLNEVRWIRIQDGRYSIINIFKDNRDQQRCDLPEYTGRTEVMRDGLAQGRVALKLFNVSVADEGTYRCYLGTLTYFDFGDLELKITAQGSDPRIDIEGFKDDGIKLVCRSVGWYPEPTLVNKYGGKMNVRKEENGLYSIEYSRVITENSNRTFSCMVRIPFPNQERETSVYLAGDLFRKRTDNEALIAICTLIPALLAAVVALFILWTRQRKGNKTLLLQIQEASLECAAGVRFERLCPDAS